MDTVETIEALFLHATEGILLVNASGEIVRINPSAEKLFGYDAGALVGKKIELLIPARFGSKHADHRNKYVKNSKARSMGLGMELYGLRKNGEEFPVEISLSPYETQQGKFVIAFIVDITIRKQSEEQLKNYSVELEKQVKSRTLVLEEAIEELEITKTDLKKALAKEMELNDLKSKFVSMASHEFRTPLTTMMSSVSLVARYADAGDQENLSKHIVKIKTTINYLTDILNDFLSLSRLEEGKLQNNPEEFNLLEFTDNLVSEVRPLLKSGQEILIQFHEINSVHLDRKLLKNILINLLSNAIKFSPENSPIEIGAELSEKLLKLFVKDHGIGIPKADQKHMFQRFYRGQNATYIPGTGLGLNIVSKYAELMNGSVFYESKENIGTTFTLLLPQ